MSSEALTVALGRPVSSTGQFQTRRDLNWVCRKPAALHLGKAMIGEEASTAEAVPVRLADAGSSSAGQSGGPEPTEKIVISEELREIYSKCKYWDWRGQEINYVIVGNGPPVLLVHGFGASIGHWRRNIGVLAKNYTVHAIDLIGLGASSKPVGFPYTMETWGELLLDYIEAKIKEPTVLIGNSIGSLACLTATASASEGAVRGLVLLNCAGGMNNKATVDDFRLKLLTPILWLIDFLLQRKSISFRLFNRVKSKENLKSILSSVYCNKEAVDDELVEIIRKPAEDDGALDAFVSIITGPAGPTPMSLFDKIKCPVLVLWGDTDPFTPVDGPVGRYFTKLPTHLSNVQLFVLPHVGHCPHDDNPELVHAKLLPWLAHLQAQ